MNELFENIRKETIIKVFDTALEKVRTSRTELSKITDLSFVSVSKVIDRFIELDIFKQSFTVESVDSKKSRLVSTKQKYWIGIYGIHSNFFSFSVCDLSFRRMHSFTFDLEYPALYKESLIEFLERTIIYITEKIRLKPERCLGIGILVPGEYNEETDTVYNTFVHDLDTIKCKELFTPYCFKKTPIIRSVFKSFSEEIRNSHSLGENIFSLFLHRGSVLCSYINTNVKNSIPINNLGVIGCINGRSLDAISITPPDPDAFFDVIANVIFSHSHCTPVDKVYVSGNLYSSIDAVSSVLYKKLALRSNSIFEIPPDVVPCDLYETAIRSISREIRTIWLYRDILEEDLL